VGSLGDSRSDPGTRQTPHERTPLGHFLQDLSTAYPPDSPPDAVMADWRVCLGRRQERHLNYYISSRSTSIHAPGSASSQQMTRLCGSLLLLSDPRQQGVSSYVSVAHFCAGNHGTHGKSALSGLTCVGTALIMC